MRASKTELAAILADALQRILQDDSFEGHISWTCMIEGIEPETFDVQGSYRVGNREGQGGYSMIPEEPYPTRKARS